MLLTSWNFFATSPGLHKHLSAGSRCIALYVNCFWPGHCFMSAPTNTAVLQGHSICQFSISSMWGVEGEVCICLFAIACGTRYAKSVTVQLNWCTQLLKAPTKHGG